MKYYSLFVMLFLWNQISGQVFQEHELPTKIKEVTVFLQGAQITRTGESDLTAGISELIIKSISPHIDDKSIQVKAAGDFTVLGINHRLNYLNRRIVDEKIDSLRNLFDTVELKIAKYRSRIEVLHEMENILTANRKLTGDNSGVLLTDLSESLKFFDQQFSSIKLEELITGRSIDDLTELRDLLQKQMSEVSNQNELPTSEIVIRVESGMKTNGIFEISYLVANAGWYPNYDIRVKSIEEPIKLTYKAAVFQNTGEDWNEVKLRFSNGVPTQSGVAPDLSTWYLNYARNTVVTRSTLGPGSVRIISGQVLDESGEPLIGAAVMVKGTTIGTISDIDGKYSLTLPNQAGSVLVTYVGYETKEQLITSSRMNITLAPDNQVLDEVVVTGYGLEGRAAGIRTSRSEEEVKTIITTTVENQTTVDFEVETAYSIKSNGELISIDLSHYQIEAQYEYFAVPKRDKDAFLLAKIIDWDQYNLLEGEANLYFEDSYVGRSVLNANALADTLNISLGRDKNIVIGRAKIDDFTRRKTIGSNKVESRAFRIIARNRKSSAIKLVIQDQIPVAAISQISITARDLSGGVLDEQTGQVRWELDLLPQGQKEIILSYEVKYPKGESLILE